jgi:hypothetical protein
MKLILVFLAASLVATLPVRAETIRLIEAVSWEDMSLTFWEATTEQVQKWPRWDIGSEPPLTASKAVSRALESLPSSEDKSKWTLDHLSLQQPMKDESRSLFPNPVFFYFITLQRKGDSWTTLDCLVVLDGTVIKPKKEKLPAGPRKNSDGTTTTVIPK